MPQGAGFFVIKVDQIIPGNPIMAPALIGQVESQLGQAMSQDYAQEFLASLKREPWEEMATLRQSLAAPGKTLDAIRATIHGKQP